MLTESDRSAIIRSLEKILADEKFAGSPQMSAFLRYVVTETLQGNADRIKAYTVAVDALGKRESFDPQNDPSVRVLANRLRSSLDQYYKRTDNHEKIIEIRAGSYIPIFSEASSFTEETTDSTPAGSDQTKRSSSQDLRFVTDKVQSIQADIAPATVKPEYGDRVADTVATSGNETVSKSASAFGVNAIGAATSPVTTQKHVISDSAAVADQLGDAQVRNPPTKTERQAQKSILDISAMASMFFRTVQAHKLASGSLLVLALATLTWGFNDIPSDTETAFQNNQDEYALMLASASETNPLRQRPAIPTVIVRTGNREDRISQSLLSSISHVLSKFDHLQVVKTTHDYELSKKWPEDYEIVVDTLVMNDSSKITVNLVNAASGRISYSDELYLNGDVATSLTKSSVTALARFVARIVQKNGPMLSDYKNHENYSETMACIFSITSNSVENGGSEDCLNRVIAEGQSESIQHTLRAEIGLIKFAESEGSKRKAALQVAMSAAQKKLDLAPHSADAHALMMRVFQLSGDYNSALEHGNHAIGINDLDGNNILALSVLLDEMKKPAEADVLRKQATALSPISFGATL